MTVARNMFAFICHLRWYGNREMATNSCESSCRNTIEECCGWVLAPKVQGLSCSLDSSHGLTYPSL